MNIKLKMEIDVQINEKICEGEIIEENISGTIVSCVEDISENDIEEEKFETVNDEEEKDVENIVIHVEEEKEINISYDTLVLSGGALKGFVSLGAIQYAKDNFLINDIKNYVGTSSGAIICYLLIIGYTPIEIVVYISTYNLIEKMQNVDLLSLTRGSGIISFHNVHECLEKMTIEKIGYLPTMLDIKNNFGKTFICVTHNISDNVCEYLSHENYPKLPCLTALRMTSNLPYIFDLFKYGNNFYVDGGVSNNFPVDIGDKIGKKILGVLTSLENRKLDNFNTGSIDFIFRILYVPIRENIMNKIDACSDKCKVISIDYEMNPLNFHINSKNKLDAFSAGYQSMKEKFE